MDVKTGYKTTEFWISLIGPIVGLLVIFGVVSPPEANTLAEAITQGVVAVFALITAVAPIVQYIRSRTQVKAAAYEAR